MEGSTESSRDKHPKNWLLEKNIRGDENEAKEDEPKPRQDSKEMENDETFVYCSRKKSQKNKVRSLSNCCESSMLSIGTSFSNNCCLWFGAFARYIRAVFNCLYCLAMCHIPQTEFERLFGELLDATGDACLDIICFMKKLFNNCGCCPK